MNIKINKENMIVEVINNNEVLKTEELGKDSFRDYMVELSGDNLDVMRKVSKLFKPKSYEFKDIG